MFTGSAAANLAQQTHYHLNHPHAHQQTSHQPLHGNQNLSISQHFSSPPIFSVNQYGLNQLTSHSHQPNEQAPNPTTMPSFLDANQHLIAHFNQPATASGQFVTNPSQFVTVVQPQHQPNSQVQDSVESNFGSVAFFQQNTPNSISHHHPNHQQLQHPQHTPQQLSCANLMTASVTTVDSLSLNNAGHVIVDPSNNSLFRLSKGANVIPRNSVIVDPVSGLRQQPRATTISKSGVLNNGSNLNTSNNNSSDGIDIGQIPNNSNNAIKLASYNNISLSTDGVHNHESNIKSSNNKSKSNGSKKKNKPETHRNTESPKRIFACPTCCKGFTEKFNMKRHMQIHSQSRPKYTCNECSKSFAWKDNFIRHKKAAHEASLQRY